MHQRRVLYALCLLLIVPLHAASPQKPVRTEPSLGAQIRAIINQPQMASALWGIDVVDLESGKTIYSLNPDHLFLPASNVKLLTTAAALALAGPDYRFHTTVETTGKLDSNGRLLGDLVIVGRGDANISGRVMPYQVKTERISPPTLVLEQLADQLVQKGLKIVDGDLIGDDTFYSAQRYGEGWAYDDLQWIDGAPVSALSFNDNVLFIRIHPGEQVGEKALVTLDPETTYYEIDNRIVTSAAGVARKIGVHRDAGSLKVFLWGSLPLNDSGTSEAITIEDPAEFTAQLFRSILEKRGITVTGKTHGRHGDLARFFDQPPPQQAVAEGRNRKQCCMGSNAAVPQPQVQPLVAPSTPPQILAEHVSLPLLEDIRVTNKASQNLHAELMLRLIGKLKGGDGSFEDGSAARRQFLLKAGLRSDEFFLLDGSGLSRRDLITPESVAHLLTYASRQAWGPVYEQTLPVAGLDGSLAERFLNTPASGMVHAKTGTLSHVNALSGYAETRSGHRFVFSIFCNNHNVPSSKVINAIDSIVVLLVTESTQ
ncbi:MAG TPA: D-alanyl-D-alanine carboxypeptidase/D-alanyl-D-alanine-endopeptidase [Candidatus Angelobacter sp.]